MTTAYARTPAQHFIAREGYPFLFVCLGVVIGSFAAGWEILGALAVALFAFVAFFFRNPERTPPQDPGMIVAPADGRVLRVTRVDRAPHGDGPATKVSIFMSVLNVHINRMPIAATVRRIAYHPGRFLVASFDKASEHNERNVLILEDDQGRMLTMTQIAGLVARRIVCYVQPGDRRQAGERFGMIRFGSRVDLYLSHPHDIAVQAGDRVKAGESVIGRWT